MKKISITIIAFAMSLMSLTAMAANWKYAMEEGLADPQGLYALKFKEEIEKNSKNTITIYPVGSLGESADAMEQAQAGLIQFIDQSPGFTGSLIPEAEAFLVPYLQPTNPKVVKKFFQEGVAVRKMFHKLYRKQGLELLSVFPEGEMVVTTKKEFRTPEELKGIKIRTMSSPLLLETYKAFGASPIALPWGELIGALKTGIVDGQENPSIWIEAYGLDDLAPVLTYTGHGQYTTAVMTNARFYDRLNNKDKKLIQNATKVAQDYILGVALNLDAIGLSKIVKTNPNAKVVYLSKAERKVFKNRAKSVEQYFINKTGKTGKAILEQMKIDIKQAQAK